MSDEGVFIPGQQNMEKQLLFGGFRFIEIKRSSNVTWRCSGKDCCVMVKTRGNTTKIIKQFSFHKHSPLTLNEEKKLLIACAAKMKANANPNKTVHEMLQELIQTFSAENLLSPSEVKRMKRIMYHERSLKYHSLNNSTNIANMESDKMDDLVTSQRLQNPEHDFSSDVDILPEIKYIPSNCSDNENDSVGSSASANQEMKIPSPVRIADSSDTKSSDEEKCVDGLSVYPNKKFKITPSISSPDSSDTKTTYEQNEVSEPLAYANRKIQITPVSIPDSSETKTTYEERNVGGPSENHIIEISKVPQKSLNLPCLMLPQVPTDPSGVEDEVSMFCDLLLFKLRALDETCREIAMHEINNIIHHLKSGTVSVITKRPELCP